MQSKDLGNVFCCKNAINGGISLLKMDLLQLFTLTQWRNERFEICNIFMCISCILLIWEVIKMLNKYASAKIFIVLVTGEICSINALILKYVYVCRGRRTI